MESQRIDRSALMHYDLIIPYHLVVLALAAWAILEAVV